MGEQAEDTEAPRHLHDGGDYRRLAERTSDPDVLRRLARAEYPFVWHAIARNAAAPADLLVPLAARRNSTWNDNCLLQLVAAHPGRRAGWARCGPGRPRSSSCCRAAGARYARTGCGRPRRSGCRC
ncbi:hypothetical protein GCM10010502_72570 [Kitasatospora aureofaciens]|uniref:Uncharacterized protein n=1 Tax=Kitasatospora aureofaciens TaxID=1894 RepID=A0A8H9I4G8_KITAU|nr:hypothetical protein GCM10010502_72570 [Kitasatospora aureofaciens]